MQIYPEIYSTKYCCRQQTIDTLKDTNTNTAHQIQVHHKFSSAGKLQVQVREGRILAEVILRESQIQILNESQMQILKESQIQILKESQIQILKESQIQILKESQI